jgi:hypothetical protein
MQTTWLVYVDVTIGRKKRRMKFRFGSQAEKLAFIVQAAQMDDVMIDGWREEALDTAENAIGACKALQVEFSC